MGFVILGYASDTISCITFIALITLVSFITLVAFIAKKPCPIIQTRRCWIGFIFVDFRANISAWCLAIVPSEASATIIRIFDVPIISIASVALYTRNSLITLRTLKTAKSGPGIARRRCRRSRRFCYTGTDILVRIVAHVSRKRRVCDRAVLYMEVFGSPVIALYALCPLRTLFAFDLCPGVGRKCCRRSICLCNSRSDPLSGSSSAIRSEGCAVIRISDVNKV